MIAQEAYMQGFCKTAEAYGVDPEVLVKYAQFVMPYHAASGAPGTSYARSASGQKAEQALGGAVRRTGAGIRSWAADTFIQQPLNYLARRSAESYQEEQRQLREQQAQEAQRRAEEAKRKKEEEAQNRANARMANSEVGRIARRLGRDTHTLNAYNGSVLGL